MLDAREMHEQAAEGRGFVLGTFAAWWAELMKSRDEEKRKERDKGRSFEDLIYNAVHGALFGEKIGHRNMFARHAPDFSRAGKPVVEEMPNKNVGRSAGHAEKDMTAEEIRKERLNKYSDTVGMAEVITDATVKVPVEVSDDYGL